MSTTQTSLDQLLDTTTLVSLLAVLLMLNSAYILSTRVLSPQTPTKLRVLFIWHAFDALIHFILEGSFLYNNFTSSTPFDASSHHPALITNFLSQPDKVFGNRYADNWAGKLWMVYAKADSRWAEADLTIISLELLTVLVAGPLALWVCYLISVRNPMATFWMIVLATGEIYGGFMTFAPEWLTGNQNLDGSNWMFLWLYLVFFNMLWVFLPLYALYYAWGDMVNAFMIRNGVVAARLELERERVRQDVAGHKKEK